MDMIINIDKLKEAIESLKDSIELFKASGYKFNNAMLIDILEDSKDTLNLIGKIGVNKDETTQ